MNIDLQSKLKAVCDDASLLAFCDALGAVRREKRKLQRSLDGFRRMQCTFRAYNDILCDDHKGKRLSENDSGHGGNKAISSEVSRLDGEIAKNREHLRIVADKIRSIETEINDIEKTESEIADDERFSEAQSTALHVGGLDELDLTSLKSSWPQRFLGASLPGGAPGLGKKR